jgi:hypothetical protein
MRAEFPFLVVLIESGKREMDHDLIPAQ